MSIQGQIDQLIDDFTTAAAGLFEITGRHQTAYEQGIYGCAIAKPTKRMKNALAIDREILVVVSTFSDQQQRTIKFVKKEIDGSSGRYENTLAIVIHGDPEGNRKLKNWGRDQGISILPIFGSLSGEKSEDLERRLCVELYSHDPFDVTGPVSDDANFYGRREEAIDLARKLQKGQIRSCLGIRKVGKTSIINRVLREIESNYECTCIMIDCSRDDVWSLDAAQFLNSIKSSVEFANGNSNEYVSFAPNADRVDIKVARDGLQSAVLDCENPLILVLDEVDYVTPGSPTNKAWNTQFNVFWRNLRAVYQECDRRGRTMSILVGGVSTYWFTVESIDGIENAALSFVPEEYLSPMPEGATVAMVKRLGRIAGLQFDDAAAEYIARATGNMPYWTRKCCSYIHRNVPTGARPFAINVKRVTPWVDTFVKEEGVAIAEVALKHLFRVHRELRAAAQQCHAGNPSSVPESLRRALRRYGVLNAADELSGSMIALAFTSMAAEGEPDAIFADIGEMQSSSIGQGLNEWAEEIAALGKRRNLLERRLREIAVNFLRYDALVNGKQAELKQRLLSALAEPRRKDLQNLSAEDVLNKLHWLELVKLITKEWQLFERLLGDRKLFIHAAEIINDRYDAHAKAADLADFALYRRALSQIEERVAKVQ